MILDEKEVAEQEGSDFIVTLRSNEGRYEWARGGIILALCYSVVLILSKVSHLFDIGFQYKEFSVELRLPYFSFSLGIDAIISLIAVILLIRWFRRSYFNLRKTGHSELKYEDVWASAGWFVPIVNLFFPYMIMADLVKGYSKQVETVSVSEEVNSSVLVGWWWGLRLGELLVGLFIVDLVFGFYGWAGTYVLGIFSEGVTIVSGLILLNLMSRISLMENMLYQKSQQKRASS